MKRQQKPITHKDQAPEREFVKVESFACENVRDTQYGVFLDLTLNGVKIFGCKIVEGQEGKYEDFVSMPSRKGTDRDGKERYWSIVYAPLSDEDTKKIVAECEKQLGV